VVNLAAARAASEPSARRTFEVGASKRARVAPVLVVAVALWQVLQQRAARGDVHELHPAADAQQREVALEGAARERDLEVVRARGPCRGSPRVPPSP
jgi:hypothetical protein